MGGRFSAVGVTCVAVAMAITACSSSSSSKTNNSSAPNQVGGGSSSSSGGSGTYDVYGVEALSGPAAAYGAAADAGVKAAVDVINQSGGVLGHQLKLTVQDDGADPTKGVALLQARLSGGTKPVLVVPGLLSTETVPLLPITTKYGVFSVAPGSADAANNPSKFPYHFSATPLGSTTAAALIAEMKSKGYTKIGVAVTDEEHGIGTEADLKQDAKDSGIAVTSVEVPTTAVDATSQLETLKAANPQAVVFVMNGASNGVLLKGRTKLGWTIPFYSEIAGTSFNVGAQTGPADWNNVFLQAQTFLVYGSPGTQTPQYTTFAAALAKYAPEITQGMALYVNSYDPLLVWAAAANKAGSVDPKKVAAAVETLTDSSQVPNFVAQGKLYGNGRHFPDFAPSDFVYVRVGPTVDGLVKPAG